MVDIVNRLDEIEQAVMDELKDFQRATVERIDYLYRHGQNRILVSDEVGLGKTLVARGAIAKFANLRKDEGDDLVKVVYICSNATIADQNLDKLRIVNEIRPESTNTSRLSMQHLNIFNEENDAIVLDKYIQLIPLTPETSFKVSNSQGTMDERALMFAILKRVPEFEEYSQKLNKIFRFEVNANSWRNARDWWESQVVRCNKKSNGEYLRYMVPEIVKKLKENDLWESFGRLVTERPFDKNEVKPYIVRLRLLFADISLNKLDPDLIIMDEFQRFKYLLSSDENSEMDKLTNKFFNSDDVRILMLSATPYKMYSTLDEIEEEQIDAHYREFFDVVEFLNNDDAEKQEFHDIWSDYSIKLKEFNLDKTSFIQAKANAENAMFRNICRTERITESQLGDMVDSKDSKKQLKVLREDIDSYRQVQQLLDDTWGNVNVPMDYVKSTPYMMSFMKNYQLKRKLERYFEKHADEFDKLEKPLLWLDENEINDYKKVPANNARLENLMGHVLKDNASNLLWCPPSLPYYGLEGAFEDCEEFSKTLIFSSWEMVPRMISSLVSYESERQTIGRLKREVKYFEKRRYPSPRMRFALKDDKPTQMVLFSLIYPSKFLIDAYNPIDCLNRGLSLKQIETEVKSKIHGRLDEISWENTLLDDFRWYYLAPMLLDPKNHVDSWFEQSDKLVKSRYYNQKGFLTHYGELKKLYYEFDGKLGKKPDDLEDVMCDMALASPAICTYRAYEKELPCNVEMDGYIYAPTQIGRKFIDRMNLPESIAVLDLNFEKDSEEAYWKNVLKYSKQGNLQAVFDEYVHILSNGLDRNNEDRVLIINDRFLTSFEFRTTSYDIDTFDNFKARMNGEEYENRSLRTNFAVSFTKGRSDESDTNRKKSVRDAFNSPFRPFVLASTSIGQEGLDFHNYCRRIVHWNLPSNPIDLEQREGRINRFECLAIRQNIAKKYGIGFKNNVWDEIFKKASDEEKSGECSDLIPYWGLKENDDMVKIERIVPIYPFSRDEIRYDRLIKVLSLYRLTLGQARQEELLESIITKFDVDEKEINELFINLSPYYKDDVEDLGEEILKKVSKPAAEDNPIFKESQKYGLPIKQVYCRLTTDQEFENEYEVYINLNEYWSKLKDKANERNLFEGNFYKFNPQIYWIPISKIILDLARIEMVIHNGFIEVKLYSPNHIHSDLYDYLLSHEEEIENELGFGLNYSKSKDWKISVYTQIDVTNNDNWEDAINWHIFMAKRFDEVFSDRIRKYRTGIPLMESNNLRTQYWLKLTKEISKFNLVNVTMPHPYPWYCLILDNVPYSECRIELHAYTHKRQVKVSVIIERSRQDLFDHLFENRLIIEDEIGFKLEWEKVKGRRYIRSTHKIDIRDKASWPSAIDWQLKTADKFKNVFNHKIFEFYESLSAEFTAQSLMQSTISSDYFYDLSNQIKDYPDYIHVNELLVDSHYDRFYDDGLKEKCELKSDIHSKINYYQRSEKSEKLFCEIVDNLNDLKDNELFFGDYFPYRELAQFYYRDGKYEKAIEVINDFLSTDIYVNEIILSSFKYFSEYCHTKLGLEDNTDFESYIGHINRLYPLCDQIFEERNRYYFIRDEKYEFNQSITLLLDKAIDAQFLKFKDAIRFYVNLIDCGILYFKVAGYRKLGVFCARMNSSEKFYNYYMNALKLKEEKGNILQEDFDRIDYCICKLDSEDENEESIADQFDALFPDEFRRK